MAEFDIRKFGRSGALTANSTEDVWETGGTKEILTAAGTIVRSFNVI